MLNADLTLSEAANLLGRHVETLRRAARAGRLSGAYRVGRGWAVRFESVMEQRIGGLRKGAHHTVDVAPAIEGLLDSIRDVILQRLSGTTAQLSPEDLNRVEAEILRAAIDVVKIRTAAWEGCPIMDSGTRDAVVNVLRTLAVFQAGAAVQVNAPVEGRGDGFPK
ncbi:MAG: helix-turn-helix domain-containing protein [Candidatus Hydrogenedentes bacterium]|nr:helix-turn-helix domain-containing protein [Candidatus Hydrogenedentota bacterium]